MAISAPRSNYLELEGGIQPTPADGTSGANPSNVAVQESIDAKVKVLLKKVLKCLKEWFAINPLMDLNPRFFIIFFIAGVISFILWAAKLRAAAHISFIILVVIVIAQTMAFFAQRMLLIKDKMVMISLIALLLENTIVVIFVSAVVKVDSTLTTICQGTLSTYMVGLLCFFSVTRQKKRGNAGDENKNQINTIEKSVAEVKAAVAEVKVAVDATLKAVDATLKAQQQDKCFNFTCQTCQGGGISPKAPEHLFHARFQKQ